MTVLGVVQAWVVNVTGRIYLTGKQTGGIRFIILNQREADMVASKEGWADISDRPASAFTGIDSRFDKAFRMLVDESRLEQDQ